MFISHLAGCVHSSVNKPGANGRVSYDSLTHFRLLFWTAGEQNGQAGFRDRLAFSGLVLTMYAVSAAKSNDNVTTILRSS